MTDTPLVANEPDETSSAPGQTQRRRWQIGLRTAFLVMAAIAVWMAYSVNRRHNETLRERINLLVPLAHELVIDDPRKIAVVKMEEYWMGHNRWEIYLPAGSYRLGVATREIRGHGFPASAENAPISAGRHVVAVEQHKRGDKWHVTVLCDDKEVVAVDETKDWETNNGASSTGQGSPSEQLPPDQPVVLLRSSFFPPQPATTAAEFEAQANGVLLWIERAVAKGVIP